MADIKISELTGASALSGTELLETVQSGTNKKVTANQIKTFATPSNAETKTAYEANADTNAFTDAEKTKLGTVETAAKDDQTGSEIKIAYEAEADTNAFTDAEKTKLGTVESNATADQTGAEIKTAYELEADTNAFDDAAVTKLGAIEALADVTDAVNVASSINGVAGKTTPIDADKIGLIDSAASNALKGLTWANLKATLKTYFDSLATTLTNKTLAFGSNTITGLPVEIGIAISDEDTDLTTGLAKATFRMPFAMTLSSVRSSVNTAPVGSTLVVDINESGATILSTKISIDVTEKTSQTAATPPVISDSDLADDAEMTVDIDQIGSGTAGKGLKIWLIGFRA